MNEKVKSGSRNVAIVGPYLSGKTTLLESLLFVTGAISRKGSVKDNNTVGDSAAESRDRHMSVEVSTASTKYNGIRFTELRSLTLGVGSFHWVYDHLQEVPEKLAERVIHSNGNGGNSNGK